MYIYFLNILALLVNTINIPFDRGANMKGSSRAPEIINKHLDFLNIKDNYNVETDTNHISKIITDGYIHVWNTLQYNIFPLVIGGDHTISVASISASNDYCMLNNKNLGVLWLDAHADFNTIETSPSGNLHGVPVSILCGHTLPVISFGTKMDCKQFAYYGLRDLDTLELKRFQKYEMKVFDDDNEICEWIKNYDKIYVSLDLDVLDPNEFNLTNTPVSNGLSIKKVHKALEIIKLSNKLLGMDIVEYNPDKGENTTIINDIIKNALC